MKPDLDQLNALLYEVFPATSEHSGPSAADVQHLLHDEHRRRHRSRQKTALLAAFAALLAPVLWRLNAPAPAPAPTPVVRTSSKPAPFMIRQVNDEQLFALLKDTPAALLRSPDGTSRLLVIDP